MMWTQTLAQNGYSTAVLFLDLASAFHHLVRELALGVESESDFRSILHDLQTAGRPLEAGAAGARLVGALERLGCDCRLLQMLRGVYTDTWLTVSSCEVVRTKRSTRPGSPLADAVFHVVLAQIMSRVRDWLQAHSDLAMLFHSLDLPLLTIIWADDVAIPIATVRAADLLPALHELLQFVDLQFSQHGFSVNYDLNTTNAVISFQGAGAPDLRREFFLIEGPGMTCSLSNQREIWLHFKNSYKHFGLHLCCFAIH